MSDDAHRGGSGTPLVLLHGASVSWRSWDPVLPALEREHRVFAPTLPGHRGGPAWDTALGPFTIDRLVDGVCAQLDAEGIDTAHVVGNSLGGWVALELVRRGRARSAVALSPAGAWRSGWDLRRLLWTFRVLRVVARPAFGPVLAARPRLRRALVRKTMEHGERLPPELVPDMIADVRGCDVLLPLLDAAVAHGSTRVLRDLPCPVRIAWAEHDRMIPWRSYGAPMRDVVPGAEFVRLPGVGHVPMWDDPQLVVDTVLGVTRAVDAGERALA
ncbi:alpha/beta fold hydrolase [Actinomycetospora termitidis]|uniref:Alpha/beta fold hydrolase n=1 Tax=Actinomycetospora termitidis TaxID=3053470 RepID=A0ABT7M409_9PSEU|nr:alpha/beta fold hydrolase [Actinomycetospora sp. Odt1-22]MDL5155400.1 alpha/beta fold hydrolase [Actinomycetospora sp. Odt1-22]